MTKKPKFKLEWGSPEGLTPYANNVKKHPTKQVDKIAQQIAEYGFDQPITVDKDNVIITGHGRREAALRLKLDKVPYIVRDDLTANEVKAKRIADNKVAESEDDEDKLEMELAFLQAENYDLGLTGHDKKEIEKILGNDDDSSMGGGDDKEPSLPDQKFVISVECENEEQMAELYQELKDRGLDCAMIT